MLRMRRFDLRVLVTTDLLARGVDLGRLTLVLHLSPPRDLQTYLHRVGRTGRFGTAGVSILLLSHKELPKVEALLAPMRANVRPCRRLRPSPSSPPPYLHPAPFPLALKPSLRPARGCRCTRSPALPPSSLHSPCLCRPSTARTSNSSTPSRTRRRAPTAPRRGEARGVSRRRCWRKRGRAAGRAPSLARAPRCETAAFSRIPASTPHSCNHVVLPCLPESLRYKLLGYDRLSLAESLVVCHTKYIESVHSTTTKGATTYGC